MNILVTGGAGYIGSHCCKELWNQGYSPIVLDNLINGHKKNVKWGEFIECDIGNEYQLKDNLKKYDIQAVMHFAAYAYVGESMKDPAKYYDNNLKNTIILLNAILDKGIQYFIFSSSCATYGNPTKIPIDENHPQAPISPYGKTKYMIEEIIKDYSVAYGMKYACLRYFNAAGADPEGEIGEEHIPETHLIPLVLQAALDASKPVSIYGTDYQTNDGTCIRDFIHVSDLAKAHILAFERIKNNNCNAYYNLGTGRGWSVMEIINKASKVTGRKIEYEKEPRRQGDPPVLISSSRKAYEELGWKPELTDLETILSTAWKWQARRYI